MKSSVEVPIDTFARSIPWRGILCGRPSVCVRRIVGILRAVGHTGDEFRSYLADFRRLKRLTTRVRSLRSKFNWHCERVDKSKSPGLDGLSYEFYLRMSHIFVPIFTVVFNN